MFKSHIVYAYENSLNDGFIHVCNVVAEPIIVCIALILLNKAGYRISCCEQRAKVVKKNLKTGMWKHKMEVF